MEACSDRIHQLFANAADSIPLRWPAPAGGCVVDDADVEIRDAFVKPEAVLVRLANGAPSGVMRPASGWLTQNHSVQVPVFSAREL